MSRSNTSALLNRCKPYIEMLGLLCLLVGVGFLLHSSDPFFNTMNPSPYVLVVLIFAMKYGSPVGLIAGIVCSALDLLSRQLFEFGQLREALYFEPALLLIPLVYVGVGHFVGEAVYSSIKRNEFSRKHAEERKMLADRLAGEKTALEGQYRQLENKIAAESKSNYSLMKSFERFDALEPEGISEYAVELSERFVKADRVEYWVLKNNVWEALSPAQLKGNYPPEMILKAISNNCIATSREFPLAAKSGGGDLALYRKGEKSGEIHAIVCFDIPFIEWGLQLSETLKVILREAVIAFNNWSLKFALGEIAPIEKRLRLESFVMFKSEVRSQLFTLARSAKISSLVNINMDVVLARDVRVLGIIASALRSLLRISDCMTYVQDEKYFLLFLPETPQGGVKVVMEKVSSAISKLEIKPHGKEIVLNYKCFELESAKMFEDALSKISEGRDR